MSRPTKYDDDGVRPAPRGRAKAKLGYLPAHVVAIGFAVLTAMLVTTVVVLTGRVDTLEHRVTYERGREIERFNRVDMRLLALEFNVIGAGRAEIERVNERLDEVNRDHHRACQRAADLPPLPQVTVGDRATAPGMKGLRHIDRRSTIKRGPSDFYGDVRFFGAVEFLPEEE